MIVRCPSCSTRLRVPDPEPGTTPRVRCTRCRHVFRAEPEQRGTAEMAPMDPAEGRFTEALPPIRGVDPRAPSGGSPNVSGGSPGVSGTADTVGPTELPGGFPRQQSSVPNLDSLPAGRGMDAAPSGSSPRLPPAQPGPTSGSFPIPREALDMPGFKSSSAPEQRATAPQAPSRPTAPMDGADAGAPTQMTDEMAAFVDRGFEGFGSAASPGAVSDDATERYELDLDDFGGSKELELDRGGTGPYELPGDGRSFGDDSDPFSDDGGDSGVGGIRGPTPARVSKKVDPLMEFGDVFREARGDEPAERKRYLDDDMFSESPSAGSSSSQQRKSAAELDLVGGRPELDLDDDPFGRRGATRRPQVGQVKIPSSSTNQDNSMLLDLALRESGLHEPALEQIEEPLPPPPEPAKPALATVLAARPSGGNPDAELTRRSSPLLGTLLVVVLTLVGVAGYVAYRNDGLLDLREMDQMIGVAFRGETYQPRTAGAAAPPGSEGSGEVVGAPALAAAALAPEDLQLGALEDGRLEVGEGSGFVVIEGTVTNISDGRTYRRIEVDVALVDDDGSVAHQRRAWAGNRLDPPTLAAATTPDAVDLVHREVAESAAELAVAPRQQTPFSAAFLVPADADTEGLTYRARVVAAERQLDSCWAPVRVAENAPSDDAGDAPSDGSGDVTP